MLQAFFAALSTFLTPDLALTRPSTVGYSSSPIGKTLSCVILALLLDMLMITSFIKQYIWYSWEWQILLLAMYVYVAMVDSIFIFDNPIVFMATNFGSKNPRAQQ